MIDFDQTTRLPPQSNRILEIEVLDGSGARAQGASLSFFVDDEHWGDVDVGSDLVRLEYPPDGMPPTISVVAEFVTERQVVDITMGLITPRQTIQFTTVFRTLWASRGTAKCPGGTPAGQPCVECTVRGRTYTICA